MHEGGNATMVRPVAWVTELERIGKRLLAWNRDLPAAFFLYDEPLLQLSAAVMRIAWSTMDVFGSGKGRPLVGAVSAI